MNIFYDTHAHLDFPDFKKDLPDVVARAETAGINRIISIGTDLFSSRQAIELAARFPNVFAVVGWHPSNAMEAPEDFRPALKELANHPKVVALGETGLDYHRLPSKTLEKANDPNMRHLAKSSEDGERDAMYKAKQASLFRQHLEVAAELGLNCVIHERNSFEDAAAQLQPFANSVRGVFHCFANDSAAMRRILEMNSLVSFTGILTFKNGQNVRNTLSATPLDRFMLETDSPYLAPVPYRGKRCEPAYVKEISDLAAEIKGCSARELSEATCATAREFFRNFK